VSSARGHTILGAAPAKTPDRFPVVLLVPGQGANST